MTETEATKLMLISYAETQSPVSQKFYQGLCLKAVRAIEQSQAENKQFQAELVDYEIGCESLKDSVSDIRAERDKVENILGIILRNIKVNAVSVGWIRAYIQTNWKKL